MFFVLLSFRCHNYSKKRIEDRCRARCVLVDGIVKNLTGGPHNHPPHTDKISKILKRSEVKESCIPSLTKVEYWTMDHLSDVEIDANDYL